MWAKKEVIYMERCKLSEAGICTRQDIVKCNDVPVVESTEIVNERVIPVSWNTLAVERTVESTLCDGKTVVETAIGPEYSTISSGQII